MIISIPCGEGAFQRTSCALIQRDTRNDGKVVDVLSQTSGRAALAVVKAVDPARDVRSKGAVAENGSRSGAHAAIAGSVPKLLRALARFARTAVRSRAGAAAPPGIGGSLPSGGATGAASGAASTIACRRALRRWARREREFEMLVDDSKKGF